MVQYNAQDYQQRGIFGPFFATMLLTLIVWIYMYIRRIHFIQSRNIQPEQLKRTGELARITPPAVSNPSDNLKNLFEMPVLFYALSLYLYTTKHVDMIYIAAAWIYFIFRVFHSFIHYFCKENPENADFIQDNGKISCHQCHDKQQTCATKSNKKSSIQLDTYQISKNLSDMLTSSSTTTQIEKTVLSSTPVNKLTNLETFSLMWLDANVHTTEDNIDAQVKLREAINFLQTFDKENECEEAIRNIVNEKVVLIVSGRLGRNVVPRLHDLSQLTCVYVYCFDKDGNKQWSDKYSKVKGVFTELTDVIKCLKKEQKVREKVESSGVISIFNRSDIEHTHKNLKSENSSFMWFQLLIEVLIGMQQNLAAKKELIDVCKQQYQSNLKELAIIDEFERDYDCSKAVWWYTREAFLYRLLNKALRIQNIDLLFAFRFFITDMFKSLSKEHEKFKNLCTDECIRVYRGQIISTDEFDRMRSSIGEFISINSFFSTSRNRKQAIGFISSEKPIDDIRPILFDIRIDIHLSAKPFADVTKLSYFQEEQEIIFMLGSVFRISNIIYSEQELVWIAELVLCSENDHDLKDLFAYHKTKIGQDFTDVVTLGDILFKMGEFDKAKQYYNRILNELSKVDLTAASCYFGLGNVAIEQDEYSTALTHHLQALEIRQKFLSGNNPTIASSYNQIGATFQRLVIYDRALEYAIIGLKMRCKCLDSNNVDLAQSYRDIGIVYFRLTAHRRALKSFEKAHEIYIKALPENHPDIAENLGYIGYVHKALKEYDSALQYYQKALAIDKKSLPENHPDIGVITKSIGTVFYCQHDYKSALEYYSQALAIFRKSLRPSHHFTEDVEGMIELINKKLSTASQDTD
ncbi:unnamed protein product [Rotaria socialis]|uniref:Uncharacterized protein n=1 Tax=Rotaria socialis TaxID=392032 RepID=A0A820X6A3_9BILA|nr:unnamed protein product [Rotaria socialis]CAF4527333.1 unnamed protein product [Rotaria socialis]